MEFLSYALFLATIFAVATVIVLKLVGMWLDEKIPFSILIIMVAVVFLTAQSAVGDAHSQALEAMGLGKYSVMMLVSSAIWITEVALMLFLLGVMKREWNLYWRGTDMV